MRSRPSPSFRGVCRLARPRETISLTDWITSALPAGGAHPTCVRMIRSRSNLAKILGSIWVIETNTPEFCLFCEHPNERRGVLPVAGRVPAVRLPPATRRSRLRGWRSSGRGDCLAHVPLVGLESVSSRKPWRTGIERKIASSRSRRRHSKGSVQFEQVSAGLDAVDVRRSPTCRRIWKPDKARCLRAGLFGRAGLRGLRRGR